MAPSVVWTLGMSTLTFDQGFAVGTPHDFDLSGVVLGRKAGGSFVSYDLGFNDLELVRYRFPHLTEAKKDAAVTWKNAVARKSLTPFTMTDNSKQPAQVRTVRLMGFRLDEEDYTDPASPRYSLEADLQVET